MGKIGVEVI